MLGTRACALRLAAAGLSGFGSLLTAQVMEFGYAGHATVTATGAGSATFLSIEALPGAATGTAPGDPARCFVGGYFSGTVQFGGLMLTSTPTSGEDGLLTALTRTSSVQAWSHDWVLRAESELGGEARIRDVALAPDGTVYVTGTFSRRVRFARTASPPDVVLTTTASGITEGFVAWAGPAGDWMDAFLVPGMQPRSMALDDEGSGGLDIYLTGPPELARRYDESGAEVWSEPAPANVVELADVAAGPEHKVYVTGSFDAPLPPEGSGTIDVFLARIATTLDPGPAPEVLWIKTVESPGAEHPGGLGAGPLGRLRLTFSSDDASVSYDGNSNPDPPGEAGRHAYLLNIRDDGSLDWGVVLGRATADFPARVMDASGLAVDPNGNTHVAATFDKAFEFEGVVYDGQNDAAVISVDAGGERFRFARSHGAAAEEGLAVAAPERDLQVLAGAYAGSGTSRFDGYSQAARPDALGYMAALEPVPSQEALIVSSAAADPVSFLRTELREAGAQVYRVVDRPGQGVEFVAAYVTDAQADNLPATFILTPDQPLGPDGVEDPSGWALAHLNDAFTASPYSYGYPDTCREVALYLIDTAVDTSSGYFGGNSNLAVNGTVLVRATGDPVVSSSFDHGTMMLSMIAGPAHGVAQGTPVQVYNYDIFASPGSLSARLSALTEALTLANVHKLANHPYDPAVFCIASSADDSSATEPNLESAIDFTIGGLVRAAVVLSAGNTTGNAEDYTPSGLGGSKSGVICAGAIDTTNSKVTSIDTRGDPGVDLWAPGEAVPAADTSGNDTTVTGTSASAALVAGAALVYLSGNPFVAPDVIETALATTCSQSGTIGAIVKVPTATVPWFTSFSDWADWYMLTDKTAAGNDDGDPWTNEEEFVWGLDPMTADSAPLVGVSDGGAGAVTVDFPLACHLYDSGVLTSFTLRDSSSLKIMRSSDLDAWTDVSGSLTLVEGATNDGQIRLSFDHTISSSPCFFQIRVAP